MKNLLNPFSDDLGNYLYQFTLMIFVISLIAIISYNVKYHNVKEFCVYKSAYGNTIEKTCRDTVVN